MSSVARVVWRLERRLPRTRRRGTRRLTEPREVFFDGNQVILSLQQVPFIIHVALVAKAVSTAGGAALGAGLGALTGLFGAVGAAKKGAAAGAAAVGWAAKGRAKKEAQQIQNSVGGKWGKLTFTNIQNISFR